MENQTSTISSNELLILKAKAEGFDHLVHDLAELLPPDAAIKKLAGIPLLEALKDYELKIVPKPKGRGWNTLDEQSWCRWKKPSWP